MATKKQKRALALARREAFYQVLTQEGLEAQRKDRERREIKARQSKIDEGTKKRRDSVTDAVEKILSEIGVPA